LLKIFGFVWNNIHQSAKSKIHFNSSLDFALFNRTANISLQFKDFAVSEKFDFRFNITGQTCSGFFANLDSKFFVSPESYDFKSILSFSSKEHSFSGMGLLSFTYVFNPFNFNGEFIIEVPEAKLNYNFSLGISFDDFSRINEAYFSLKTPESNHLKTFFYERLFENSDSKLMLSHHVGFKNFDLDVQNINDLFVLDNANLRNFSIFFLETSLFNRPKYGNFEFSLRKNNLKFFESSIVYENEDNQFYFFSHLSYFKHFMKIQSEQRIKYSNQRDYLVEFHLAGETSRQDLLNLKLIEKFNFFSGNVSLQLPNSKVDHSVKVHFCKEEYNKQFISKLNFQLQRPERSLPETLFYELIQSPRSFENKEVLRYGLQNFDIDVSNTNFHLARFFNNKFQSFVIESEVKTNRSHLVTITKWKKNDVLFMLELLDIDINRTLKYNLDLIELNESNTTINFRSNSNKNFDWYLSIRHDAEDKSNLVVNTRMFASNKISNITATVEYSIWSRPAVFNFGHRLSSFSEGSFYALLDFPSTPVNHKLEFEFRESFDNAYLHVTQPLSIKPLIFLFSKNESNDVNHYLFGFRNLASFRGSPSTVADQLNSLKIAFNSKTSHLKFKINQYFKERLPYSVKIDTSGSGLSLDLSNISVKECDIELKFANSDYFFRVQCGDKLLLNQRILTNTIRLSSNSFTRRVTYISKLPSADPKSLVFTLEKLNENARNINISLNYMTDSDNLDIFETRFFLSSSHSEKYDQNDSNKFLLADYGFDFFENIFTSSTRETCNLKIDNNASYSNSLKCSINAQRLYSKPINFGYNLLIDESSYDEKYGFKQGFLFDLIYLERVLRFDYNYLNSINLDEFNSTASLFYDFKRDANKYIRINYIQKAEGSNKNQYTTQILNFPLTKSVQFDYSKEKSYNQTSFVSSLFYELKNGRTNRFDLKLTKKSSLHQYAYSLETNSKRPALTYYQTFNFNRLRGHLENTNAVIDNIIKLNYNGNFSLELVNPDLDQYTHERIEKRQKNKFIVISTLTKDSQQVSQIISTLDSESNMLDVKLIGLATSRSYQMNLGFFNESIANGYLLNESENKFLSLVSLSVANKSDHKDLVFNMKWNGFWKQYLK